MLLWFSQSVSRFGDQFTALAIPVLAAYSLGAGPVEMGYIGAAGTVPFLLFGLLVGVWLDRMLRRPVLVLADVLRGLVIGAIAVLGLLGFLHLSFLYAAAFVVGVLTVFFNVAYQSYLPALVERKQLVDANSKLETTSSLAQVLGPGLAGAVIAFLSAPIAMLFDALSFGISAGTVRAIRKTERGPDPAAGRSLSADLREGLSVVFRDRRLRAIAVCTGWSNFFASAVFSALIILYFKDALHFDPLTIGLVFAIGGIGGVVGAIASSPVAKRVGVGPSIVFGAAGSGAALLPVTFVHGNLTLVAVSALWFLLFFGALVYNVNQVSYRQALVPLRLQGRLNATMKTIAGATAPLGSLFGGFLGNAVGLSSAILLSVIGGTFSSLWVLFSPVRTVREMPERPEQPPSE
jgi:predicted MFS family arabinose efflux permease